MLHFWQIALIITLAFDRIKAQTGGTTAAGDSFVCVPAGFCNNGGTPTTPGIDPRIVTPGGTTCPAGQIPCYTQGPSSRCGQRLVTPTPSNADGPAAVGAHPWQAFIRNSTNPIYAGSGVLIDNWDILTAAHKVALSVANPASVTVIMGVTDPTNLANTQTRTAARIIVHPQYNPATLMNDIAIIRVAQPFSFNQTNINSLCLPAAGTGASTFVGQTCTVAGWGETRFTQNDQPTNPMKQVNLRPVDYATCRAGLLPVLPAVDTYLDQTGELCAGGETMRDACTYDGGAPLTCPNTGRGTMAGLVIWGKNCGQANVYGVYVSVPYYRGWIDTTITQLNNS